MRWRHAHRWLVTLALAGCSPSIGAAMLPRATVHAALVERGGESARGAAWSVRAELAWTLDRPPPPQPPPPVRPPAPWPACAGTALCVWERRAARAALRRLVGAGR